MQLKDYVTKDLKDCSDLELLNGLMAYTQDAIVKKGYNTGKKKLYYISAEFLIGKLLSNNLINLGLYDQVKQELEEAGKDLCALEEFEDEPSLGNGGLGRLASCFIDSLATLGYPADGMGIAYHCGLFKQTFLNHKQYETPDYWQHIQKSSWLKRSDKRYTVNFGKFSIESVMYEISVTGFKGKAGKLRLFDTDSIDERLIKDQIRFDKKNILKNLTLFLYPDDSDEEGRLLRVYQEYFMCASAAQCILEEAIEKGSSLHDLSDYAAIQINDTHPSFIIPELIKELTKHNIDFNESITIVQNVCGYTNHTILAEALETWPKAYIEEVAPEIMRVIEKLHAYIAKKYSDPFVQIIDENDRVHMANMDIHFSHSVNGVAKLHTDILKNTELKPFADIYPDKFNNKTNGITFRRWCYANNRPLRNEINRLIGDSWVENAEELEKLLTLEENTLVTKLLSVKDENKRNFATYLANERNIEIDPESIIDVQAKRLHEYKRQQLNLLWAIAYYQAILNGKRPDRKITVFFAAKAAPAYTIAKDIIHAILTFGEVVNNDPLASKYLQVVMLENYNVSLAEKLIPAADISEQISLASKEASGTGNMKFMLNGAITLGTMDGANVEIYDLVGKENIYTFGKSSEEVIEHYANHDYVSKTYYDNDPILRDAVDFLCGDKMKEIGDTVQLERLYNELLNKDWFMTFLDFEEYCKVKETVLKDYEDRQKWGKMMLQNIARAGFFSSDRTIEQYNSDIWHLKKDK